MKFPVFYKTQRSVRVFTRIRHLFITGSCSDHCTPSNPRTSTSLFSKRSVPFRFSDINFTFTSQLPCVLHAPSKSTCQDTVNVNGAQNIPYETKEIMSLIAQVIHECDVNDTEWTEECCTVLEIPKWWNHPLNTFVALSQRKVKKKSPYTLSSTSVVAKHFRRWNVQPEG